MNDGKAPTRRRFLKSSATLTGAFALGACDDKTSRSKAVRDILSTAEPLNRKLQRFLAGRKALAPEYGLEDISPQFRANGNTAPQSAEYRMLAADGFRNWRLAVTGLVLKPLSLSLDEIRALPARTQITRHDCVEGWSCIGQWTGARLGALLDRAVPTAQARYVVFRCADTFGTVPYYESIDLADAYHEQTILAYEMNGAPLPIAHGAPLRVRLERMLGYKQAKYIMRIELTDALAHIGLGKGGYWEDRGYEWYGGI